MKEKENIIFGKHSLNSALRNQVTINKVWLSESLKGIDNLINELKNNQIPYKFIKKSKLDEIAGNTNHQGYVAEITNKKFTDIQDIIEKSKYKDIFIVILDGIKDPHNLGAIIRTSVCAGVDAIIIPKYRAVGITGTVAKTSAGTLNDIDICRVTNISQTINLLKKNNIWVVGLDINSKFIYTEANLKGNIALVIGSEGEGISKIVKESCDFTIKIPMKNNVNSLNASVASAIIVYEVFKQRNFK
ncbi:MAG: 23S rRNA (guanosine(2251)-2'-O)-methyltransferase RlmB [Candidatus Sericytochromatia bacterium]|nr:MAG: 23S rRNA (guanosine(2251)-2'-O)-methyltransferase RlmB [Candidatus Sericytochromatia bacterium]